MTMSEARLAEIEASAGFMSSAAVRLVVEIAAALRESWAERDAFAALSNADGRAHAEAVRRLTQSRDERDALAAEVAAVKADNVVLVEQCDELRAALRRIARPVKGAPRDPGIEDLIVVIGGMTLTAKEALGESLPDPAQAARPVRPKGCYGHPCRRLSNRIDHALCPPCLRAFKAHVAEHERQANIDRGESADAGTFTADAPAVVDGWDAQGAPVK